MNGGLAIIQIITAESRYLLEWYQKAHQIEPIESLRAEKSMQIIFIYHIKLYLKRYANSWRTKRDVRSGKQAERITAKKVVDTGRTCA